MDTGTKAIDPISGRTILSASFVAACLLTVVGGFLDAYTHLAYDQVFANAQTGNIVLLGMHLSAGEWFKAARHLPPVLAFFVGAALTRALFLRGEQVRRHGAGHHHPSILR